MPRLPPARACALAILLAAAPVAAQEADDPVVASDQAAARCAAEPEADACSFARDRTVALMVALMVALLAEAGKTRDRGAYIDLVRQLLADPNPEIRTSAAFTLARLEPDASDTPAILALLFDPVSHVRAGGWAAAGRSSDAALRAVTRRVPTLPVGWSYAPDTVAFDPAVLGADLPAGAAYLWLTAALRNQRHLEFLTDAPPDAVLAAFAPQARGGAVRRVDLLDADPAIAALALAYHDIAFDRTGFAVILAGGGGLVPASNAGPAPVLPLDPPPLADGAAIDTPAQARHGGKPDAP